MSSIPEEIYFDIFLKVPVKSLLACKFVCKAWFSLISSHDFVKTHLNLTKKRNNPNLLFRGYHFSIHRTLYCSISDALFRSQELLLLTDRFLDCAVEIEYPFKGSAVQFLGSCDGLVCLWFLFRKCVCLWNPATREYKELANSRKFNVRIVAFGYDYKSDNYKLFAGDFESSFEVYSLGSKSWKTIENVPYKFVYLHKPSKVIVNGDYHWLARRKDSSGDVIVSLDISDEVFKEIELPKETLDKGFRFHNFGVLEGCLCVLVDANQVQLEVWIMQDYGVRESWTKHCVITHDRIMRSKYVLLICSFKTGMILFEVSGELIVYDPKNKSAKRLSIPRSSQLYEASYYFESLVSLNSGTYVGKG